MGVHGRGHEQAAIGGSGIESEAPPAFAALRRLLAPLSGSLDRIPAPPARALRVVLGMEAGDAGARRA